MQDPSIRSMAFPVQRERVLHLRVAAGAVRLSGARFTPGHCLPVGWEGLAVLDDSPQWHGGELHVLPVCEAPLAKLQAFFDMSTAFARQGAHVAPCALLPVAGDVVRSPERLDRWYIENWTFWLDVKILLRTVVAVFSDRGAH